MRKTLLATCIFAGALSLTAAAKAGPKDKPDVLAIPYNDLTPVWGSWRSPWMGKKWHELHDPTPKNKLSATYDLTGRPTRRVVIFRSLDHHNSWVRPVQQDRTFLQSKKLKANERFGR